MEEAIDKQERKEKERVEVISEANDGKERKEKERKEVTSPSLADDDMEVARGATPGVGAYFTVSSRR